MIHPKLYLEISMRAGVLFLLFGWISSVSAQQLSASDKLREAFLAILKEQVTQFVEESPNRNAQVSPAETSQIVESLMKEAQIAYGPLLILPEGDAGRLLADGPNDKANMDAMQRDIALWKEVQVPWPALYKKMQGEVVSGEIKGGLELELIRRISEFHLKQLGKLSP